jgi:hypothetical protein
VEDENAAKDEDTCTDWEEGRQVEYDSMQPAPTEDDDEDDKEHGHVDDVDDNIIYIDKSDFKNKARYQNVPSFDQSDNSSGDAHQPASFQPAADAAKLAVAVCPTVEKGFFKGLIEGGKNKNTHSPSKNQSIKGVFKMAWTNRSWLSFMGVMLALCSIRIVVLDFVEAYTLYHGKEVLSDY